MRILAVSPVPTHPTNMGTSVRILSIYNELMELGHEVWFLHVDFQKGDREAMSEWWGDRYIHHDYRKPWRKFRFFEIPVPDRWHHALLKRGLLHQRIDQLYDFSLDPLLHELQKDRHFDAVLVEYANFSRALLQFGSRTLKVINTHDVYSDRHKRLLKAGVYPEWFFLSRREERKGLLRADRIIAVQDKERDFFKELTGGARSVTTVGLFQQVSPLSQQGNGRRLVFLGANATLNVRSVQTFLNDVWPLLLAADRALELHLWGGVTAAVDSAAPNVFLHRELDEVATAYSSADIVINPMIAGTGLKIKTVEALAFGCPVVASAIAVDGLPCAADAASAPWLQADSPGEWVSCILKLSHDPVARRELSRRAIEYMRTYTNDQRENLRVVFQLQT